MKVDTLVNALVDIWPMLTISLVVIVSLRIAYLLQNREKIVFYKEFSTLVFVVYILLLYQLLTNTELNNNNMGGYNLVPFTEILRYKVGSPLFFTNVIGNIVIFIPLGYLISMYVKARKITPVFLTSVVISATVETVQLNIGRSFDVDDIILNMVGALIGYIIYKLLNEINKRLPKALRSDTFYNILCITLIILAVIYIANRWKGIAF